MLLFFIPYPIYDGVRLFLWSVPYLCLIPGLVIYYLITNLKFYIPKISFFFFCLFFLYFLFNFIIITPYQYTYLNIFNGSNELRYKKFENDYWGSSIKELIKNSNFKKNEKILIATCGVSPEITKKYFKDKKVLNLKFVNDVEAQYIIMTNRTVLNNNTNQITNCFDMFKGSDVFVVKRNNMVLSTIRKIDY